VDCQGHKEMISAYVDLLCILASTLTKEKLQLASFNICRAQLKNSADYPHTVIPLAQACHR